jgi:hypothetical protein
MMMGSSFAATCAQLEESVVEQPAAAGFCPDARGFWTGGSCPFAGKPATAKQTRNQMVHERARVRCPRRVHQVRERSWSQELALARPELCRDPPPWNTSCDFIIFAPLSDDDSRKKAYRIIRGAVKPRPSGRGYKAPTTTLKS